MITWYTVSMHYDVSMERRQYHVIRRWFRVISYPSSMRTDLQPRDILFGSEKMINEPHLAIHIRLLHFQPTKCPKHIRVDTLWRQWFWNRGFRGRFFLLVMNESRLRSPQRAISDETRERNDPNRSIFYCQNPEKHQAANSGICPQGIYSICRVFQNIELCLAANGTHLEWNVYNLIFRPSKSRGSLDYIRVYWNENLTPHGSVIAK